LDEKARENILLHMLNTGLTRLEKEAVENILLHMRITDLFEVGSSGKYSSAHAYY
jgi:hypothetical protein